MNGSRPRPFRVTHHQAWPLYDTAATRVIEQAAQAQLPPHTLMQRAGLAVARLALAIAPHAQRIWVACGPGNNGGDGLEAAMHLHRWGKQIHVTWLGQPGKVPHDSLSAWQRAHDCGVAFFEEPPQTFDLVIDALLGLGCQRPPEDLMADWLSHMHTQDAPILQVDLPSGLEADTGVCHAPSGMGRAANRHTLSLLTLKPGLFTAEGRDAAGQIWLDDLETSVSDQPPTAWCLSLKDEATPRRHSSHKGTYGDVAVIGGAPGMNGAAVLASIAALQGGAGRVYAALLDTAAHPAVSAQHPALMTRPWESLDLRHCTVVCGCGGGQDIRRPLPSVLSQAERLVLDADALNAIATDPSLNSLLRQRSPRKKSTVLTPHPLEAARLLECSVADIQNHRLQAAAALAQRHQAIVVLKGSGSVIAAPGKTPVINASGNARLATAGTGDVLAGLIGASIACADSVFEATCQAVAQHGRVADQWPASGARLTAEGLAACLR